jgi:hypothetical protein
VRLYCLACEEEGRTAVFFEPPHDLKQWHVHLGMRSGPTSRPGTSSGFIWEPARPWAQAPSDIALRREVRRQ